MAKNDSVQIADGGMGQRDWESQGLSERHSCGASN